jgi:hypothetical protein
VLSVRTILPAMPMSAAFIAAVPLSRKRLSGELVAWPIAAFLRAGSDHELRRDDVKRQLV